MPRYPVPPDIAADIRLLKLRVKALEVKVANLGAQPPGTPGNVFDANVIWNGAMESGTTGWARVYAAVGSLGTTHLEAADPLDQLYSLREDESASSATRIFWLPSGNSASPVLGSDVFATGPGEQWQVKALVRANTAVPDAKLYATVGDTAPNVYGLPGFTNTTWLLASNLALTAGVVTAMSGLVTVPASRSFISVHVCGGETPPAVPWSWWLDDVVLQRKLN